jgi:hypothetical protein
MVVADQIHDGCRHLNLRSEDGASFLVPAWMTQDEASCVKIVDAPCLSLRRLLELRAFVDSVLASHAGGGEEVPGKGGVDDDASDIPATGFVRDSAAADGAGSGGADEVDRSAAGVADGGDGDTARRRRHPGSMGSGR